ncbi:hypothetical protein MMC21_006649 [Puttea exsequens]|nr:hypothetical protein [Puttea exsequens]
MEASTATAQSMQNITTTKLAALSAKQQTFETAKQRILEAVPSKEDPASKVRVLLDAFANLELPTPSSLSTANIRRFLEQSRHDTSISSSRLQEWQFALEKALDVPSQKYEHASLFGRLVMEWLGNPNHTPASGASDESEPVDLFEHVGRKEMHDQRKEWESIVFTKNTKANSPTIETYLEKIFGSTSRSKKLLKTPLEVLRESMESFRLDQFTTNNLKEAMKGILVTDLLSEPKRKTLEDFQNNSLILQEMTDVLNMQIDALETWTWGQEAVPVIVRRALNGKYRVYADEELIQAILLHHIGMTWAVHMKRSFTTFFHSGAWKQSSRKPLNATARRHRQDYGLDKQDQTNVRNERRDRYQENYFMVQLPNSYETTSDEYDDMDEDEKSKMKSPMAIKKSLLHLISTETIINTRLHGSFAILQSDFKWFGPSLPQTTILTVLRFLGVKPFWLTFFEKFLKAPLKFIQDGPDAEVQVRQCGVPIQHRLSDALGEAVLFCLDFAVNKSTECNLYRMHDDLWFWGSRSAAAEAWKIIKDFAEVMGLGLNEGKTGSVDISEEASTGKESASEYLPRGDISWGFMTMERTGKWALDDKQVDGHIREIQTQLSACKSVFAWVQAWNMYVTRFLSNNFGEPANCLGRPHVDMTIKAFEKIQKGVFASDALPGQDVLEHLRGKLNERFGITDIPDGFFYFPVENGGLGLRNPFIPLLLVHKHSEKKPVDVIERAFELEEIDYNKTKKSFEDGTLRSRFHLTSEDVIHSFISFEEYIAYAEETSAHLQRAYTNLLDAPAKDSIESTNAIADEKWTSGGFDGEAYEDWVLELYGGEVMRRYGGLAMGEKRLLPIGLVSMLKSEKIRWQG